MLNLTCSKNPVPIYSAHPTCSCSDSGDVLRQACWEGWEDFSLGTTGATMLFRTHMMSRGVFGATAWPVSGSHKLSVSSMCSTCCACIPAWNISGRRAGAPASLPSDAVMRRRHSCQPFLAPFRLKLDLPHLTDSCCLLSNYLPDFTATSHGALLSAGHGKEVHLFKAALESTADSGSTRSPISVFPT